jgi:predicted nucleic acid-binding protein
MAVVSNSTPLIALSKIGKLNLLREYFDQVFIPKAVYDEVVVNGGILYGAEEVAKADWIAAIPVLVENACMGGINFLMFRKNWAVHLVLS